MARPRQISDEQILAMMSACVLEHGPQVSLDLVAGQLGVTGPALLKRFGSREELMLQALRPPNPVPGGFLDALKSGPTDEPLEGQLEAIFTSFWAFIAEVMPRMIALRESGIDLDRVWDKKNHLPLRTNEALVAWLDLGVQKGLVDAPNTESVALAMVGSLQARATTCHLLKQPISLKSQRTYLKDLARLFTRAVTPAGDRAAARPLPKTPRNED